MLPSSSPVPAGTFLVVVWLIAVGAGFGVLNDHAGTPGSQGEAVASWPLDAELEQDEGEPQLLLFAHAMCPCTDATLAELERALADTPTPPRTRAVVWSDPAQVELFSESRVRDRVAQIPGVAIIEDVGGRHAADFGIHTSGALILFDAHGRRVFSGGITPSRGHEGGNAGLDALRAGLRGEHVRTETAPVFGCSLGSIAVDFASSSS